MPRTDGCEFAGNPLAQSLQSAVRCLHFRILVHRPEPGDVLGAARGCQEAAVQQLWERYFRRLVALARSNPGR
jgi:hypothetical protein